MAFRRISLCIGMQEHRLVCACAAVQDGGGNSGQAADAAAAGGGMRGRMAAMLSGASSLAHFSQQQ